MSHKGLTALLALFALASMSLAVSSAPMDSNHAGKPVRGEGKRIAQADAPKVLPAAASDAEVQDLLKGNDAFAFRMMARLRADGSNLFFSPFSIRTAFAMMSAGARGETLDALNAGLDLRVPSDRVHVAMKAWLERLRPKDAGSYKLSVANSLWGQQGYGFLESFVLTLKEAYKAEVRDVDFTKEAEKVRQDINRWVEEATAGLIKDLIPAGGVTGDTGMVLVNAVYFKGSWVREFEKALTKERPFHLAGGSKVEVPMMSRSGDSEAVAVGKGVKMLRLAYKGDNVVMDVLLPDARDGLPKLLDDMTPERLAELDGRLRFRDVNIQLPKFTMRWGTEELTPALREVGLAEVFGSADFSGVAARGATISAVFHQAFVDVNEEGTEAAAATAIVAETGCAMPAEPPLEFVADHPFLFLIREGRSGAILFMGVVENPVK